MLATYLDLTSPSSGTPNENDPAPNNGLSQAVAAAYNKIPTFMSRFSITDAPSFLRFANDLLTWVPSEGCEGRDIYDVLCMFYFVLGQEPLGSLQARIVPRGERHMSWLSDWMVVYAQMIGSWMDSGESITQESLETFWRCGRYNLHEAVVPEGGFRSFNEFFGRRLREGARDVEGFGDDEVVVYPADCRLAGDEGSDGGGGGGIVEVERGGVVRIKGLPWTIGELLGSCGGGEEFEGGIWMHAFLNTYNYHHVHAPVSGRVIEARKVRGLACFEVVVDEEEKKPTCRPVEDVARQKEERGLTAPNTPGYQFLQTRGVVIIENPLLGKVAVLPVGMAMVSSVRLSVEVGDVVEKGDEIAGFAFGGSDVVCVFEGRAGLRVEDFVRSPRGEGEWSRYGSVLARVP
ncbi:phosphatidylserine decarboxylase-domain-containing protein [Colletotrichum acutatum]|uniref:Phosphatidylserine decarboxylase-domain-containing protein n=1 Tax=Glomerella acutata TaxID=27357 RepID=A0AAD8UEF1_GLOAC|nr:phosphatidylserine decarboxylase-domain-containing protein [Colletotrichum acutatum]KAK1722672.1 phosphatidylserine decarboxylase-domain-containing protein [Colletotrichum acutatum]